MMRPFLLLAGLTALPALAADKTPPSSAGSFFQVFVGLLLVLAVMAAAAWVLKRFSSARTLGTQSMRIVGGVSVGTRERVMVVEVADQWIVVGVAPGQVTGLATMPRQEIPAPAAQSDKPDFASWLKNTIDKRKAG